MNADECEGGEGRGEGRGEEKLRLSLASRRRGEKRSIDEARRRGLIRQNQVQKPTQICNIVTKQTINNTTHNKHTKKNRMFSTYEFVSNFLFGMGHSMLWPRAVFPLSSEIESRHADNGTMSTHTSSKRTRLGQHEQRVKFEWMHP